ncbi:putative anaerobic ribonucleoside triphosphate reductase [Vibrio phage 424E50-1]|nr:putative anaerobic ribonucleoside triphosphate reductase [Vibrio phage 424E50-1]
MVTTVMKRRVSLLEDKILDIVLQKDEDTATDNANKDSNVFSTQRDLIAGAAAKHIAEHHLIPKHLMKAHSEGLIHCHDLDYFPLMGYTNCCLVDLQDMLENGFSMNGVKIETPKGIQTAMTLASQIVMAVGSQQYGGISFNRLDEVLETYVTMSYLKWLRIAENAEIPDKLSFAESRVRKEVYDACQTFEYQVNSMTCTSGQSPFISVGFGLGTSWEARLIQEMILKVREEGIGGDKMTAIFPKLLYSIKEGINRKPQDINYDIKQMALACAAKRLYPDILNYDKVVEITGSFKASMGCRSFLSEWKDSQGNLKHSGRCNLGVTTLNLPMIAVESKTNIEKFWELLNEGLELCKQFCEFRLEVLSKTKARQAPTLFMQGALLRLEAEEYVLPHLLDKGSSISIGYIGLNEMVNAMFGEDTHIFEDKLKKSFALEVLSYINNYVNNLKEKHGIGYSVYATPSERQCYRLCKCVEDKFGVVVGVTDKEYFTNSFHLEANKQTDPYSRMLFEAEFVTYSSGGFISYGEFPEMTKNLEALEDVWDFSYEVTPYYAVNVPSDKCLECSFEGELRNTSKGFVCPKCNNSDQMKLYAIRRVSGYLGSPAQRPFNLGKSKEVKNRVKNL